MGRRVFISYAHEDSQWANRIKKRIEQAGLCVWIDRKDLKVGTPDWKQAIHEAIDDASCMIVLLSPNAVKSEYVGQEIVYAKGRPIHIFAGMIAGDEATAFPPTLENLQFADMRVNFERLNRHFREVAFRNRSRMLKLRAFLLDLPETPEEPFEKGAEEIVEGIYSDLGICAIPQEGSARKTWLTFALALLIGVTLCAVGYLSFLRPEKLPYVSLIGLRYTSDGTDLRWINLQTSATDGIPFAANDKLQFRDIWVWAKSDAPEYKVYAEVYFQNQILGSTTESKIVQQGRIVLGDIVPKKEFQHPEATQAWKVQDSWDTLQVVLVITDVTGQVKTSQGASIIRLDKSGKSWIRDTPNVKLTSVLYSVNNGPKVMLDMSAAGQSNGITVPPESSLSLHEIWYASDTTSDKRINLETYLGKGTFDSATDSIADSNTIEAGTHKMANFKPITWAKVPPDRQYIMFMLVRDDHTVTDQVKVPISDSGHPGLVNRADAVLWPFQKALYLDFEFPSDLSGWQSGPNSAFGQSSNQAFSGSYSLAVGSKTSTDAVGKLVWTHDSSKDRYIVANFFFPVQAKVAVTYAQICKWACKDLDVKTGQWITLVVDLNELKYDGTPVSLIPANEIVFNVGLQGVTPENQYLFYIDGIQVFPAS